MNGEQIKKGDAPDGKASEDNEKDDIATEKGETLNESAPESKIETTNVTDEKKEEAASEEQSDEKPSEIEEEEKHNKEENGSKNEEALSMVKDEDGDKRPQEVCCQIS